MNRALFSMSLAALVLAAPMAIPRAAEAKDLCVADGYGATYIFKKAKSLKKPGGASPLHGFYIASGGTPAYAVSGSAVVRGNGSVHAAIFIHTMAQSNNFTAEWVSDLTLAGSGSYDSTGDYNPNGPIVFTAVDCKTVIVP